MVDTYWNNLLDFKIAAQYFQLYANQSNRCQVLLSALCMIFSFTGVITWVNSTFPPSISILAVLASQVISVLQPLYPFGNRIYAAQYIYREYDKLALGAEQTLNGFYFGNINEKQLISRLKTFQDIANEIESKYGDATLFPPKKRLHKLAQTQASDYLRSHFNLGE